MTTETQDTAPAEGAPESNGYENLSAFASEQEFVPDPAASAAPVNEPEPAPEIGAGELAFFFGMAFDLVAARRGDHWKLSPEESDSLGEATDAVMQKYMPNATIGPEAMLLITAGMIVVPRVMADLPKELPPAAEPVSQSLPEGEEERPVGVATDGG